MSFGKVNKDFYPTPSELSFKMISMIDRKYARTILEPSAGKGNLADAIKEYLRYRQGTIDCIEIEPELRATLTGKGHTVIDTDFLSYQGATQYDTIIMNPPFSQAEKHILKAWDMLYDGDLITLMNAETIKNPFSKERKLIVDLVKQYGTCEFISNAFVDAENKTGVEVALVKLSKRNTIRSYFDGMKEDHESFYIDEPTSNSIALSENQIANMVIAYNKAIEYYKQSLIKQAESQYYEKLLINSKAPPSESDETQDVKKELNEYIIKTRKKAWSNIIYLSDFEKYMTERVQKDFNKKRDEICRLEFSEENIRTFLLNLSGNFDNMINQCCLDVFDMLTRYYEENRVHPEGWKSNDYFFVNKRVVLPRIVEENWYQTGVKLYWESKTKLTDLDRVMAFIDGKSKPNESILDTLGDDTIKTGFKYESEYFYFRFFKKGTAHFYFKNLKLLEKFNILVGQQRGWLPKAENKIPKEFWLMNS